MQNPAMTSRLASMRRQRGVTLIESLVAFAVISLGTVSVIRLQRDLRLNADLSGQRAEASHLSEGAFERQRADSGLSTVSSIAITSVATGRNALFTVGASLAPIELAMPGGSAVGVATTTMAPGATESSVSVSWPDRSGTPRAVSIDTIVALASPSLSAALAIRPIDSSVTLLSGRAASIPADATNLGNRQAAWMPNAADRVVYIFDNATGRIVSRCSNASPSAAAQNLTLATVGTCVVARASMLSGIVRTSLATPPDPANANDPPSPLAVLLTLTIPAQAQLPACTSEAQHSVEAIFGTGAAALQRRQAVALVAKPASIGATRWTDLGDTFVAYRCVVIDPPGGWTGRSSVVPGPAAVPTNPIANASTAWKVGTTAGDRKVCRYVRDPTAGSADPNAAHPAQYTGVTDSLAQQNFLLIRGDQQCPGLGPGAPIRTEQHQP